MTPKKSIALELIIILAVAVTAYCTAGLAPFLSLDDLGILENLQRSEQNYFHMFLGGGGDYFRPLTFVSFLFDLNLFGHSAQAFHLVNLTFHCANVSLIYCLAHKLIPIENSQDDKVPLITSLVFALHPINTEAVMWVASRTDLICCFFFLLAMIVAVDRHQNIVRSAIAIFFLSLMSLLSKESSVGLIGILLVLYLCNLRKVHGFRMLWMTISVGVAEVVYLFMRTGMHLKIDSGVGKVINSGVTKSFGSIIYDSAAAFGFYISKVLYPFPLNFAIITINKPISFLIFICSVVVLFFLFFRIPRIRLPLLIFSILLVPPVLALHGKLPWTPYAERYLYLPLIGFALLVGFSVGKLPYKAYIIVFMLILLMSVPTMQRVILWGNPLKFWSDVMQKSPEFPRSYVGVANELLSEKKYDQAELLYRKSLEMGLNQEYVWHNLAIVYLGKGNICNYEMSMLQAAKLAGNSTPKYINLIQTISNNKQDDLVHYRIIGYYLKAQERDPRYGDGFYNAAKEYLQLGDTKNALVYFKKFLNSPGDSMYVPFAEKFIKKLSKVSV